MHSPHLDCLLCVPLVGFLFAINVLKSVSNDRYVPWSMFSQSNFPEELN